MNFTFLLSGVKYSGDRRIGNARSASMTSNLKAEPGEWTQVPSGSNGGPPSLEFLSPAENRRHLGRLAGYEVLEMIGRGGMGTVLKARDPKLERLVAVKVLNPALASSGQARARFLREARSAAAVMHEHVVTIHAVDDSADVPFLVMEYIVGVSLEDRIQHSGQLQLEEVLRIGCTGPPAFTIPAAEMQIPIQDGSW